MAGHIDRKGSTKVDRGTETQALQFINDEHVDQSVVYLHNFQR
jgi:hypothetical protein